MILKWVKGKNFLSVGNDGVHIKYDELGDIVVVKGVNLDVSKDSSNGSGKSNLYELIVYGLFGKMVKGLTHKEAINKKTKKGLEIEVCFELDGHEYIVIRGRKPDKLKFLKDGEDTTLGSKLTTQQEIENIIKINYEAFVNIVCFGEHNNHSFLSCDAATKRIIIENLLGLEKYLKYCKIAKENLKDINGKITILTKGYESSCEQRDSCILRIENLTKKQSTWILSKNKEIESINNLISSKLKEIEITDDGILYEQAQERLKSNKNKVIEYESQRLEMVKLVNQLKEKQEKLNESKQDYSLKCKEKIYEIESKKNEVKSVNGQISELRSLKPGVKCSACYGVVDSANYQHMIDHHFTTLMSLQITITDLTENYNSLKTKSDEIITNLTKVNTAKKAVDDKYTAISGKLSELLVIIQRDSLVKEPQVGVREILLKEQLSELNNRLRLKKEEVDSDPYVELIKQGIEEKEVLDGKIKVIKDDVDDNEELVPYYEYWINGFGDDGIRAFIIDGILPALNARVNYWLQFLIDNKISLNFDNKFDVVIERNPPDGDPFVYDATSGGERRRINLAISQAFAYVTAISCGIHPNLCFLDEISLNVDVPGVYGIYKMICELAKDRQVFVTTHDPNLNDLLSSCDTLIVTKKDGFSRLSDNVSGRESTQNGV